MYVPNLYAPKGCDTFDPHKPYASCGVPTKIVIWDSVIPWFACEDHAVITAAEYGIIAPPLDNEIPANFIESDTDYDEPIDEPYEDPYGYDNLEAYYHDGF